MSTYRFSTRLLTRKLAFPFTLVGCALLLEAWTGCFTDLTRSFQRDTSVHVDGRDFIKAHTNLAIPNGLEFTSPKRQPPDTRNVSFWIIGEPSQTLKTTELDIPPLEGAFDTAFNPALLRLPPGSDWTVAVVARGPHWENKDLYVEEVKKYAQVETLLAFGADISASGKLIPLTPATYLEFPNNIGPNCGYWTFATGAEDPRLYWSEDMRPMLSYIMPNPGEGYCRGPALWEDLRLAWPALGEALRNVKAIPSTKGRTLESSNIAYQKASSTEKNWMFLYPGAVPDPSNRWPHFHYGLIPPTQLLPNLEPTQGHLVDYRSERDLPGIASRDPAKSLCIGKNHPHNHAGAFHGATPFYRMTLCPRGTCAPTDQNTVLIAASHIKKPRPDGIEYGRFFATLNVTAPWDLISVGPEIRFNGLSDSKIVYALSLTFLPSSEAPLSNRHTSYLTPSHGFIDDSVIVSFGVDDREMATSVISAVDMISRHKMCDEPLTWTGSF